MHRPLIQAHEPSAKVLPYEDYIKQHAHKSLQWRLETAMKIQYVSDLHLETFGDHPVDQIGLVPADGVEVLVLAGDITSFDRSLTRFKQLVAPFQDAGIPMVYVPGNHEYYRHHLPISKRVNTAIKAMPGIHLLDNERFELNGVRFLGSTLWTPLHQVEEGVPVYDELLRNDGLNDFRYIRIGKKAERPMTPQIMRTFHCEAVAWLEQELMTDYSGSTIVITHWAPTPAAIVPEYAHQISNAYFITDCRPLMSAAIDCWIFGHTHVPFDLVDDASGLQLVCNPRGYPILSKNAHGLSENQAFDPLRTIDIANAQGRGPLGSSL